jgi:hypothetical protein
MVVAAFLVQRRCEQIHRIVGLPQNHSCYLRQSKTCTFWTLSPCDFRFTEISNLRGLMSDPFRTIPVFRSLSSAFLWGRSLQLGVLRLRSDEDGNVGVGVFPERKEILIGALALAVSPCMA